MRTALSEQYKERWPSPETMADSFHERTSPFPATANGLGLLIPKEPFTPSPTSTFTSRIESWCLNLSSREFKVLSASYWTFTALCCITFFTSHWSIFLAFLIPALITNHLRVLHRVWKTASINPSGPSTSGT